jgi:hypothetical protein
MIRTLGPKHTAMPITKPTQEAIMDVSKDQFAELLLQMLETEQGG